MLLPSVIVAGYAGFYRGLVAALAKVPTLSFAKNAKFGIGAAPPDDKQMRHMMISWLPLVVYVATEIALRLRSAT